VAADDAKPAEKVAQERRNNMAPSENERIVTDFCNAWSRLDADELTAYFTPDGVYHNMPLAPLRGQEEIREGLKRMRQRIKEIRIEILHQVSSGNVVMNERVDYMVRESGRVALPAMGIFELEHGKIKAWREYFDLGMARGTPPAPSR
jgi:limonene-1,2-epoxide hydrolase